jgi:hypothetical protein
MPDSDQFGIYNSEQLSIIKNTFAENDVLLYAIRKVFLQFPLTEPEKNLIRMGVTDAVYDILKIRIMPDLSPTFPLGQLPSLLTTLTNELRAKGVEEMEAQFDAKMMQEKYLTQQFAVLKDLDAPQPLKLADMAVLEGKDQYTRYVAMTSYLFLLGYIDPSLNMIKVLAGSKDETPEQQVQRLKRDSNK